MRRKPILIGAAMVAVAAMFIMTVVIRRSPSGAAPAGGGAAPAAPAALAAPAVSLAIAMPTTASSNAADSYRQAARLMDALQADSREGSLLGKYEDGAFDADAGEFFERHAAIVGWVRRGASLPDCDWGASAMDVRLPALGQSREIGRFTLLHGKFAASRGDIPAAVDDAVAALALARHVGADHLLVSKLVEIGVEIDSAEQLATLLPLMSSEQLKSLQDRLAALPPASTGAQLMGGALAYARKSIREQNAGPIMIAMADSLEPLYTDLGAAMDSQSPEQFAATVDEKLTHYSMNTIAKLTGPAFKRAAQPIAVARDKQVMLNTAIEILLQGDAAIATSKDLFGDGPFGYTKTKGGFVLTSNLQQGGKPVTLTVGK